MFFVCKCLGRFKVNACQYPGSPWLGNAEQKVCLWSGYRVQLQVQVTHRENCASMFHKSNNLCVKATFLQMAKLLFLLLTCNKKILAYAILTYISIYMKTPKLEYRCINKTEIQNHDTMHNWQNWVMISLLKKKVLQNMQLLYARKRAQCSKDYSN